MPEPDVARSPARRPKRRRLPSSLRRTGRSSRGKRSQIRCRADTDSQQFALEASRLKAVHNTRSGDPATGATAEQVGARGADADPDDRSGPLRDIMGSAAAGLVVGAVIAGLLHLVQRKAHKAGAGTDPAACAFAP